MRKTGSILTAIVLTIAIPGCESDDERLARFAAQSVDQQAQQNKDVAVQHQEITKTARALIEADSRSRTDFAKLAEGLQDERHELGRQRDALENERRLIAAQRYRDPLIADAIQGFGLLFLCSIPLVIAFYVLRTIASNSQDEAALNELLVQEVVMAELPRLSQAAICLNLPDANKS